MDALLQWLIQQAPVVVVMGVVIWWLAKRLIEKDKMVSELSKEVIKLTTMWEAKAEDLSDDANDGYEEVLRLLKEIRNLIMQNNNK